MIKLKDKGRRGQEVRAQDGGGRREGGAELRSRETRMELSRVRSCARPESLRQVVVIVLERRAEAADEGAGLFLLRLLRFLLLRRSRSLLRCRGRSLTLRPAYREISAVCLHPLLSPPRPPPPLPGDFAADSSGRGAVKARCW
eukprot:629396-Hanusia_phi.AAC.1